MAPIQTSENGRTPRGQFGIGNKAAVGHSSKGKQLRAAVIRAISEEDIQGIVLTMIDLAIGGDIAAAKLILSTIGPPTESDAPPAAPEINDTNFQEIKRELLARAS